MPGKEHQALCTSVISWTPEGNLGHRKAFGSYLEDHWSRGIIQSPPKRLLMVQCSGGPCMVALSLTGTLPLLSSLLTQTQGGLALCALLSSG